MKKVTEVAVTIPFFVSVRSVLWHEQLVLDDRCARGCRQLEVVRLKNKRRVQRKIEEKEQ